MPAIKGRILEKSNFAFDDSTMIEPISVMNQI
jgi:hypothetical protein